MDELKHKNAQFYLTFVSLMLILSFDTHFLFLNKVTFLLSFFKISLFVGLAL